MPPFDKAAFSLKTNEISQPVKSVYGYHIIQALGPVKPAHTQTFAEVKAQIQANLASQQKQTAWQAWLAKMAKDFKGKVAYQVGYAAGDDHDADELRRRPLLTGRTATG